jgi:pimeloyl-ACP methyl ester carboxylesterase
MPLMFDEQRPLRIARQGSFFAGGAWDHQADIMFGQMWVQFQVPAELSHPSPVVMIHGGGQTGVVFQGTPDGRPGWSDAFVAAGFAVYVVDLPGRGRAQGHDSAPPDRRRSSTAVGNRVAHVADPKWPQAIRHTQWPASDADGADVFEQFYASQVPSATEATRSEALARAAGCALLQRIGPSVLLSHSQGGPVAWGIADSRPELVSGIVAIEPNGPPVHDLRLVGAPDWFEDVGVGRAWGLSRTPLTFDPPATDETELRFVRQKAPDGPGLAACWLQAEPARTLPHLHGIPILVVSGEASYHAPYDHATSRFLRQAGVEHDFVRLADLGMRGNGHMMMLERNSLEIASYLQHWIADHVCGKASGPGFR